MILRQGYEQLPIFVFISNAATATTTGKKKQQIIVLKRKSNCYFRAFSFSLLLRHLCLYVYLHVRLVLCMHIATLAKCRNSVGILNLIEQSGRKERARCAMQPTWLIQ